MAAVAKNDENDIRTKILAINNDASLTDAEKGRKRQELLMGRWAKPAEEPTAKGSKQAAAACERREFDSNLAPKKSDLSLSSPHSQGRAADGARRRRFGPRREPQVHHLPEPLRAPGHGPMPAQLLPGLLHKVGSAGQEDVPVVPRAIPRQVRPEPQVRMLSRWRPEADQTSGCPNQLFSGPRPRINTALTFAIRLAKNPVKANAGPAKDYKRIDNESRPDEAFVSDKAQRSGRANASSGRIMVTTPNDHFGPIGPEFDPIRNQVRERDSQLQSLDQAVDFRTSLSRRDCVTIQCRLLLPQGVLVGEWWKDRLDCRQWGAHFPHVAGIAGQVSRGGLMRSEVVGEPRPAG